MADPGLLDRLPAITVPVLVVWGEADRMIPVEHGQAYARAIPGARFLLIPEAGHLPQLETPDGLLAAVWDFAADHGRRRSTRRRPPWLRSRSSARRTASRRCPARSSCGSSRTAAPPSHRLGMAEIIIAPHTAGPPQHRHARHDEGFYVVSGTVRFTIGEQSFDAPARTLVMVPPGAPHTFANPGDEPAVILNTFTPDLYVQYFRDLRDMAAAASRRRPEQISTSWPATLPSPPGIRDRHHVGMG